MQCSRCSATATPKGSFVIPAGTAKTTVAIYQCRGCMNVDVKVESTDN